MICKFLNLKTIKQGFELSEQFEIQISRLKINILRTVRIKIAIFVKINFVCVLDIIFTTFLIATPKLMEISTNMLAFNSLQKNVTGKHSSPTIKNCFAHSHEEGCSSVRYTIVNVSNFFFFWLIRSIR